MKDLRLDSDRSIVSRSYTLAASTKDGHNVPRRIVLMSVDYEAEPPEVVAALATMLRALEVDPPEPGEARDLTPPVRTAPAAPSRKTVTVGDVRALLDATRPLMLDALREDMARAAPTAPRAELLELEMHPGGRGPSSVAPAPPAQRGPLIACQSQFDPDE